MRLDYEQELASKYVDSHSLIIAGAGTGKTTTLLKKVDYLIENGIKENEILVISFTNETVNNFKQKCPHNVDVLTFHKLAKKILETNKELVEEDVLQECILDFLINITIKLKKKIYYIFNKKRFTISRYNEYIKKSDSASAQNYIFSIIKQIKTNNINIKILEENKFSKNEKIILYIVNSILNNYNRLLKENEFIDFDDLIILATKKIRNKLYRCSYKQILVDEYQDISLIRQEFLKSLVNSNNSILTAVGDDFQSIYKFSGSNIDLFYNFQECFQNSKLFYIKTTYRCPQNIVNIAGKFIMKNKLQIKKNLISTNHTKSKIHKIYTKNVQKNIEKIISKYINNDLSMLILGRNNFDIKKIINNNIKFKNSYLYFKEKEYKKIRYLTVHKSKGLEADIVIIINLSNKENGFPNKQNDRLINKLVNYKEKYKYAEERRLFYVALTRCKKELYLLIDKNNPSIFVNEI